MSMVSVGSWTVHFLDEGATSPVQMAVAEPLAGALARAAEVNAGKDEFDLSFSSLFIGVLASEDTLGTLLRSYFEHAQVDSAGLSERRHTDFAGLAAKPAPMDRLSKPLLRTASARSALTEAERVCRDASGPEQLVDLRHLIAAYIALPNYHDEDFRTLRINRPAWAREFSLQAQELYPSEFEFWSAFAERAFPGWSPTEEAPADSDAAASTLYGFAPDVYSERDLLGIEREVNGLASLIASHKTSVPLSIGLFGKWGSGKTFFIRHLQRRIRELCTKAGESGKPQAEVAYFKHVAQIEFNAWHYSEGTLIASLVEHILQNLRTTDDESDERVTARRELILSSLIEGRQQEDAADDRVKAAQDKVDAKQIEIDGLKDKQQDERKKIADNISAWAVLDTARTAVSLDPATDAAARAALRKLGITEVGGAARDLQATLGRARDELAGIGGVLLPLIRGDEQRKRVLWLLFVIAVPIAAGAVLYELLRTQSTLLATLGGWASSVTAFLTLGKKWLDDQLSWVTARRRELEQAKSVVDDAVERQTRNLQARQARDLAEQFEELERLRAEHAAALRERDERARERGELETALARTSSTYLLNEFIMDRASAKDYRQLLGFMALVRRDFDKLSRLIERSNRRLLDGGDGASAGEPDPGLNRIVLYIDDLDRCPEDRVAEVLRAVHLLLAFPLFVVVVAVDSRWLTRCLMERYPKIFGASESGSEASATPMDYLEKIFQIPLWLRHLSATQRVDMVRALLRDGSGEAKTQKGEGVPLEAAPVTSDAPKVGRDVPTGQTAQHEAQEPDPGRAQQAAVPVNVQAVQPIQINLNPPGLAITDREWTFIEHLGPILSHTPRVLKRFANTYRLVKGGLPDDEVRRFVSDRPEAPYRLCLFQLAVLVSMPSFVPSYLGMMRGLMGEEKKTLWQWHADLSLLVFHNDLPKPPYYREEDHGRWALLHSHLQDTAAFEWRDCPVRTFAEWAPRVARYTFTPE
jgi:hypothetical protein